MTDDMDMDLDSKEQEIGYHKGALTTLSKERQELQRILNIVDQLMQMHIGALKEQGVDLEDTPTPSKKEAPKKTNQAIEDLLNE
jgi:hypothetical protein